MSMDQVVQRIARMYRVEADEVARAIYAGVRKRRVSFQAIAERLIDRAARYEWPNASRSLWL